MKELRDFGIYYSKKLKGSVLYNGNCIDGEINISSYLKIINVIYRGTTDVVFNISAKAFDKLKDMEIMFYNFSGEERLLVFNDYIIFNESTDLLIPDETLAEISLRPFQLPNNEITVKGVKI
jgi:hypothetical protein